MEIFLYKKVDGCKNTHNRQLLSLIDDSGRINRLEKVGKLTIF
jgi:hypothetical protein